MQKDFTELSDILFNIHRQTAGTTIIAVDGCGGAGKSTFAAHLADSLHTVGLIPTTVIHTDDFASWDNPLDWWPRMIEQVFEPLKQGGLARYQRYDWQKRKLAEWYDVEPGGLVVVEGVSSSRSEFRKYLEFAIWVECPGEIRLIRGLMRDGQEALFLWNEWMAREDEYIARDNPMGFAKLVVNGNPYSKMHSNKKFEILRCSL